MTDSELRKLAEAAILTRDDPKPHKTIISLLDRIAKLEAGPELNIQLRRNQQFVDGFTLGIRRAIAHIHAYADEMDDPSAKAALDTCAHRLGIKQHGTRERRAAEARRDT